MGGAVNPISMPRFPCVMHLIIVTYRHLTLESLFPPLSGILDPENFIEQLVEYEQYFNPIGTGFELAPESKNVLFPGGKGDNLTFSFYKKGKSGGLRQYFFLTHTSKDIILQQQLNIVAHKIIRLGFTRKKPWIIHRKPVA